VIAAHWEDYWASGGTSDRALGGADQRAFLAQYWGALFASNARASSTVVDLACGDGAVFAFGRAQLAAGAAGATLIAVDAAPAAARAATRAADGVVSAAADASRLPLRDGIADIVVSQFGLEYSGKEAFSEAARIVARGGVFAAICHLRGGAIDTECRENARVLQAFADERLAECALAALAETHVSGPDLVLSYEIEPEIAFRHAMQRVAYVLRTAPESAAKAMVASAVNEIAAVATRRLAYDATQALAFVDHITASLAAYSNRMRAMLAASLDQNAIGHIAQRLQAADITEFGAVQVAFAPGAAPSAWRIEARRAS
jgi:SAM-dependent methyltransferase